MKTTGNYIISGGIEGKQRLNTLSEVPYPYTKSLLEANGVTAGMSFLDVGCGGGNVSLLAAQIVGSSGLVTAIDFDEEIIALNRADAETLGYNNISYKAMAASDMQYKDVYDIAYARFLLSHLTEPTQVLEKMVAAVKPGGKVIVEDVQFSGHYCYPSSNAFQQYVQLYSELAQKRGQDPEIGAALFSMFCTAGMTDVQLDVINPVFNTGAGKWMACITMEKIKDAVIAERLADEQTVGQILNDLEVFTRDGHSIISMPRIFRVSGVKR